MSEEITHVGCPKCVSFSEYDDVDTAESRAEAHNESMHDGKSIARVIQPDSEDSVNEFEEAAREHTPQQQYEELVQKITQGRTPFTVATID